MHIYRTSSAIVTLIQNIIMDRSSPIDHNFNTKEKLAITKRNEQEFMIFSISTSACWYKK
jgi:hypothetical protein